MRSPLLLKQICKETLLCAARQIPVVGPAAEIWAGVEAQRAQLAQGEALSELEARLSRFERGQRALARRIILEVLADLRDPTPARLTESLRELRQMQSQGYMVGLFEGLLADAATLEALRAEPTAYGQVLGPEDPLSADMMPLFLTLDDQPRILQAPLSGLSALLKAGVEGEARLRGDSVWALPRGAEAAPAKEGWLARGRRALSSWRARGEAPAPTAAPPPPTLSPEEALKVEVLWSHAAYRPEADLAHGMIRLVPDARLIDARPELRVPVHHVLLLDLSGSMDTPDKYPRLLEAVTHYEAALGGADWITLIPFSSASEALYTATPIAALRAKKIRLDRALEGWSGRFGATFLAGGVDLAARAVEEARARGFEGVTRVLCMSDGQIHDMIEARFALAELFKREARFDVLGFGADFALQQAEALVERNPQAKVRYVEASEGRIAGYFAHLARTSQRVALRDATLTVEVAEGVSCFEVFSCRPNERLIADLSDEEAGRVEIPIGGMECRKSYLFLLNLRAWEPVEVAATLTVEATLHGAPFTLRVPLEMPLGEALGEADGFVCDMAASLQTLSRAEGIDAIEATRARLRLYQLEGRGERYIQALEHKLRVLERGPEEPAPWGEGRDMALYAEAGAETCSNIIWAP